METEKYRYTRELRLQLEHFEDLQKILGIGNPALLRTSNRILTLCDRLDAIERAERVGQC